MTDADTTSMQPLWRRYAPLAAMALALVAFFGLRLDRYASFELLVDSRARLMDYIGRHFAAAFGAFILTYAALVAISAPGATLMTVAGGALFGVAWGLVGSVVGATAGACGLFLAARSALGETLAARAGPKVLRLRDRFKEHAVGYLLFLRMSPLFPFWFVNLAAALAAVPLRTFFWTTALGVLPAGFVFTAAGAGMDEIVAGALARRDACRAAGQALCKLELPLSAIVTPKIFGVLIGLSLFALAPIVARRIWAARKRLATK
ncbi:MAG: TVP38/TMEM64 family protein [Hyphomicrobiales bacterium]|nr:TVP38/TMEM64 family protein [Hyphomicrobiales bacterium]